MALNTPRAWLITYDITNPKRLSRLHRFLRKHAVPVQFSVFHYEGSAASMGQLAAQIETRIDPKTDDVRIYQLPEHLGIDTLGRGGIPGETYVFSGADSTLDTLLRSVGRC